MANSKSKKITIFFIVLIAIIVVLAVVKAFQFKQAMAAFAKMAPPPPTISTVKAEKLNYQPSDTAVGTFKAINGVEVTPQVSGQVTKKYVNSGQVVSKGQPLIQLDDRTAKTTLANDSAAYQNAHLALLRAQRLIKVHAIGKSDYDTAVMNAKQANAALNAAKIAYDQHTIKAPFAGKLGIFQVDIGQFINPGEAVITLQTQSPIHLNFNLPEKDLADLVIGGRVEAQVDRFPNKTFVGKVNAINSTIDPSTHTISVQATFPNTNHLLYPGGFATVNVHLGQASKVIGIPNTAITYRLYGDSVYVVTTSKKDGKTVNTANLKYITLGDPIDASNTAVIKGLNVGDVIVSAGQNKLQIKNTVNINNKIPKTDNPLKQFAS